MISPDEIRKLALNWWKQILQSALSGNAFFPKTIDRIGKIQPGQITQHFETLQKEVATLYQHSKNQTGIGYRVETKENNFRRTGSHELPDAVVFETVGDYVSFTGKIREWKLFLLNQEKITGSIPRLKNWALPNCLWLTDPKVNWDDILQVCHYFLNDPRPNLYLRQLPITVHTKFIEENTALLQSLLDFLIPDHIRNVQQKRFAERYFLRCDEPLIRMRVLDVSLSCFSSFPDISIPHSDFEKLDLAVKNVLIAENKMNFLTLPSLPDTIAVWSGGGFNISFLRNAVWLAGKKILYWGDIDEHGFQILHQLRSYYPKAQSVMMDEKTFGHFSEYAVAGARNKSERLAFLNDEERALFERLKLLDKNRLEQEKISQGYVEEYFRGMLE